MLLQNISYIVIASFSHSFNDVFGRVCPVPQALLEMLESLVTGYVCLCGLHFLFRNKVIEIDF